MSGSEKTPIYRKAPMSNSRAEDLARVYGHPNLRSFIEAIPPGADVMDLGSGRSRLGHKVCRTREDIRWLNVDQRYVKPQILKRVAKRAPPNLEFLGADALDLVEAVGSRRFDRLYSNWMLPHIILESRELGLVAARNMIEVVKPTGQLAVAPCTAFNRYEAMTREISDYSSDPEHLAQMLVQTMTLPPGAAQGQIAYNHLEAFLSRFNPRSNRM